VLRKVLQKTLEEKGVRNANIQAIKDMYDTVTTNIRTLGGKTKEDFPIWNQG